MIAFLLRIARSIDLLNDAVGKWVGWAIPLAVLVATVHALARTLLADTDVPFLDAVFNQRSNAWFEIQWYLFSAVFLLAAAATLRRNEHVRIDVVSSRLSRRAQAWIDIAGFLFFLLPMAGVFIFYGLPYALLSIESQEINNAGGLPTWPAKALIVMGFFLLGLQGIAELIKRIGYLAGQVGDSLFERQSMQAADPALRTAATPAPADAMDQGKRP